MFATASSSKLNVCSPWILSTDSFKSSSGCFHLSLKLPHFGFLMVQGMTGRGLVKESEDEEDFLQVDL